jgi:integrase
MPRHLRDHRLETAAGRRKLPVSKKPIWISIGPGLRLGFRANQGVGSWSVGVANGKGKYQIRKLGLADDIQDADGRTVLSFYQAQDLARSMGRGPQSSDSGKLQTVAEALDTYKTDLASRGAEAANATRVLHHLEGDPLAGKTVALLRVGDFATFRDKLIAAVKPATVNRTLVAMRASLELARKRDPERITRAPWETGLELIPDAERVRNSVLLPDSAVKKIVACGYMLSEDIGLWIDTVCATGARASQVRRLVVANLQDDRDQPRLLMPSSKKGRAEKVHVFRPVPVTKALATRLRRSILARGAGPDAPLLTIRGKAWGRGDHAEPWRQTAALAKVDPGITSYSARHSSICRQLLGGVPVTICARTHDTSPAMLNRVYSAFIADIADAVTRASLIETTPSDAGGAEVIPFRG